MSCKVKPVSCRGWISQTSAQPAKRAAAPVKDDWDDDDEEDDDDWRKFFDEPAPADDSKKSKSPAARLHKLTVHQSLHSLPSHKAVFTRAWLSVLQRLSAAKDEEVRRSLAIRALNVMHRGVLPHLTRAILAMDWIAGCVDHGQ